jgi:cbb3-type cytochrome oxidase maturation protein
MTAALLVLLPVSLLFVIGIGVAFWWAIFAGQFDDMQASAESILHDDDGTVPASKKERGAQPPR